MDVRYYGYHEEDEYGQEADETEVGAVAGGHEVFQVRRLRAPSEPVRDTAEREV